MTQMFVNFLKKQIAQKVALLWKEQCFLLPKLFFLGVGCCWNLTCGVEMSTKHPFNFLIPLLTPPRSRWVAESHAHWPHVHTTEWTVIVCFQTEVSSNMFYHCSPVPTRESMVVTRWFSVAENVFVHNSASASLTSTLQVIFMDCLQVAHIWHSKEVCNFYTLSSGLFILWKFHSKGHPCSTYLPNFRLKRKSWM